MLPQTTLEKLIVSVRISGTALQEHKVPKVWHQSFVPQQDEDVPRVQKCIESQPGQNFDLELKLEPGFRFTSQFNVLKCTIKIDGKRVMNMLLMRQHYRKSQQLIRIVPGMHEVDDEGVWRLRRFKFADLAPDDSIADTARMPEKPQCSGTIEVTVFPCKSIAISPTKRSTGAAIEHPRLSEDDSGDLVADTAVILDKPESLNSTTECWKTEQVSMKPLAIYTFWYCTKAMLQKLGVLTQPRVITVDEIRPWSDLSRAELLLLLQSQQKQLAKNAQIIKELEELHSGQQAKVIDKHEPAATIVSREPIDGIEVIDLTGS